MKYLAIIKDATPQFGGVVSIVCFSRIDAVKTARRECIEARAIGIKCYGRVEPKRVRPEKEFKQLGWL